MERRGSSLTAFALLAVSGCGGEAGPPAGGCDDPLFIDDLEDGDRFICASGARHGSWYVISAGTGTNLSPKGDFSPTRIADASNESRYAARTTGSGFPGWGVAMGVTLGGDDAPYDASAIQGVRFRMKSSVPVIVRFPTPPTIAVGDGGTCADGVSTQGLQ